MIELKNIKIKDKMIVCTAIVEDCHDPFEICVNGESGEAEPVTLPRGYEWCKSHVAHAVAAVLDMFESGVCDQEKTIMGY